MSSSTRWLFFDVGNVIYNDDAQAFHSYRFFHRHFQALEETLSFADLMTEREREAQALPGWVLHRIGKRRLGAARFETLLRDLRQELYRDFDHNHLLNEGAAEALHALRQTHRLGIIANQPPECRHSLQRRGLLDLFDVVGISEELDLHKPNVAFMRWALDQAGCRPADAIMIGDRLDNDIAPAKEVGMKAIHFDWGRPSGKLWQPEDPEARQYLASLDRVPAFPALTAAHFPDAVVTSWAGLQDAVAETLLT